MRPRFRTAAFMAVAIVALAVPQATEADPIVITGGSLAQVSGIDLPGFDVTGTNSHLIGVLEIGGALCCVFSPGDLVTINRSFPVAPLPGQPATEVVDGTSYPNIFLRGVFNLSGTPFVAPAIGAGDTAFALTTPFSMTGQLSGFVGFSDQTPLFSVPVTGTGTATVGGRVQGQTYIGTGVFFNFQEPAATPEPATFLLVGTAMLGGFGLARRRRQKARPVDTGEPDA